METSTVGLGLAFVAGLASFLSPCVFSLMPAYIGYLGGRTAASAQGGVANRWVILSHALAFVLGFSLIFTSLGLGASVLGSVLREITPYLTRIGGAVVLVFGVHMTGLIRIPFLEYDLRPQSTPDRRKGYISSFLMGIFFSAGWSPCVGPILGAILTLSFTGGSVAQGVSLLAAYSAGLAIPFLAAATQISLVTMVIRRYGRLMRYIEIAMGVLLILLGSLLLFTGGFSFFATIGADLFTSLNEIQTGVTMLYVIFAAAILGLIPAFVARSKGRNFWDWWFFGAGLFPVALVMALLLKENG